MNVRIDTLQISKQLSAFGFTKEQAEGLPKVILSMIDDTAASKSDLSGAVGELKLEIRALEHRMLARVYAAQIAAVIATIAALKVFHVL